MGIEIEIIVIDDERRREKTVLFSSQRAGGERISKSKRKEMGFSERWLWAYALGRVPFVGRVSAPIKCAFWTLLGCFANGRAKVGVLSISLTLCSSCL